MSGKTYFKITHTETGEELYACTSHPVKAELLCDTLCLTGCTAEQITKEQYEEETGDEEEDES